MQRLTIAYSHGLAHRCSDTLTQLSPQYRLTRSCVPLLTCSSCWSGPRFCLTLFSAFYVSPSPSLSFCRNGFIGGAHNALQRPAEPNRICSALSRPSSSSPTPVFLTHRGTLSFLDSDLCFAFMKALDFRRTSCLSPCLARKFISGALRSTSFVKAGDPGFGTLRIHSLYENFPNSEVFAQKRSRSSLYSLSALPSSKPHGHTNQNTKETVIPTSSLKKNPGKD